MAYHRRAAQLAADAVPALFDAGSVPTVFVIHKEESTRNTLESLISRQGWGTRVYADARAFLTCDRVIVPSCLVLGLSGDGQSGLDLQQNLLDRPELPIVFVSDSRDIGAAVRAIKAGAMEFLLQPVSEQAILYAIERAIDRSIAVLRREARVNALLERYAILSQREREIMELVISGRLNKEVARELGIAEITVKVHRGKLMRKMRAGSLAELVEMGIEIRSEATRLPRLR